MAGSDGALWFTEYGNSAIGRITTGGEVTEFPVPTKDFGGTLELTAGDDGRLWFTSHGNKEIGAITTDGDVQHYELPAGARAPRGPITTGPDGRVWFTAGPGVDAVYTMAPDGRRRRSPRLSPPSGSPP